MNTWFRHTRPAAGVLLLALAAACAEHGTPVAPVEPEPAPSAPMALARIECRADVPNRRVTCDEGIASDARALILGNALAKLTSTNVVYDSVTDIFSFDLTVQNRMMQPIGTLNGTTPDPAGVRVFIESGPSVTVGSGPITVTNADGTAAFLGPNQYYYQYSGTLLGSDGILSPLEVSAAKNWRFHMPGTVLNWSIFFGIWAPVCTNAGSLQVGAGLRMGMPVDGTFCLGGGTTGAEYVVIATNQGGTSVPLSVTATGIVPVVGQPSPTLLPGTAALRGHAAPDDAAFERGLRVRERHELAGLLRAGRRQPSASGQARPRWNLVPGEPIVGDLMSLNVKASAFCSNADVRTGRVAAVGPRVVVLADTANPAGGFTTTDYQQIAASFDTLVWPTLTGAFGTPGDEDGNERVALFFTRAVNQLTPTGGAYTASFFLSRDLLSTFACPSSNVGELIYLAVPDPSGSINGNARTTTFVKARAVRAIGHDLQHLLNASHRLYASAPPEETWLNEGLSGIAEELLFYAASGKAPRQNLGFAEVGDGGTVQNAFLAYGEPNFARLREWLKTPHVRNPALDSATHSGAWAFLRYAADRLNGNDLTFWNALANSSATGIDNLQAALGGANSAGVLMHDFSVALYADDVFPGLYALPSWNYRSLYNALDYNGDGFADGYPLAVRNPSAGVADAFTLSPGGGAAYLRMGIGASGLATISLTSNGAAPPSAVQVTVIRRK